LVYDMQHQMRLFRMFRVLSQEGLCRFVFCGEQQLYQALHNPNSPFFNFTSSLRLGYLSERDALRFDCKRTTNDSTFQDNGYYVSTFFGADFKHDFTEKLAGRVGCSYEFNNYPTEVSLDNMNEDKREDEFWSPAIGVEYKLSKYFIADLKFNYIKRDSNFSRYDYQDNRISAGIKGSF